MRSVSELPKLYGELAPWFHLLSSPADYAEEAEFARKLLTESSATPPQTVLELGSGGGNNASHLKAHFQMTLVDLSPGMLDLSRALNPECEHLVGDCTIIMSSESFRRTCGCDCSAKRALNRASSPTPGAAKSSWENRGQTGEFPFFAKKGNSPV